MRIPAIDCAWCGSERRTWETSEGDGPPQPTDFALCSDCGGLNVFVKSYTLRRATEAERIRIEGARAMKLGAMIRRALPGGGLTADDRR